MIFLRRPILSRSFLEFLKFRIFSFLSDFSFLYFSYNDVFQFSNFWYQIKILKFLIFKSSRFFTDFSCVSLLFWGKNYRFFSEKNLRYRKCDGKRRVRFGAESNLVWEGVISYLPIRRSSQILFRQIEFSAAQRKRTFTAEISTESTKQWNFRLFEKC